MGSSRTKEIKNSKDKKEEKMNMIKNNFIDGQIRGIEMSYKKYVKKRKHPYIKIKGATEIVIKNIYGAEIRLSRYKKALIEGDENYIYLE